MKCPKDSKVAKLLTNETGFFSEVLSVKINHRTVMKISERFSSEA